MKSLKPTTGRNKRRVDKLEFPLREIARKVGGTVIGDDGVIIKGINSLDAACNGEISFFADQRYKESVVNTGASALIVQRKSDLFNGPQLVVDNPMLAYARVTVLFAPSVARYPGISERAVVHDNSSIGKNVSIYPMVYVGEKVVIGDDVILFPGVFIGDRVMIGNKTIIYPNVTVLRDCVIGSNVIIHSGTVIGSDGFGFVRDGSISVKILQMGIVQIDDEVEIGANNCIDRAAFGRTWLKRGVKTDNQVQVGHNVVIGEDTVLVAQVGISGSVRVGREVIMGARAGIRDHIEVGDRAMIGAQSGVAKSVPPGEVVTGYPAIPHRLWLRTSGLVARLPQLNERLRRFEKRVEEVEKRLK
jgi:UDP-3-O-[3-hydroxymyristoyl] glucosamine N-acyltransferase